MNQPALNLSSTRIRRAGTILAFVFATSLASPRAFAVSKEMVQLQTQIQQLQDAIARLQQSNDERMGVLKDLVQQTADSVNKMSLTVGQLQRQVTTQTEAQTAKSDQVSGQVQSLNDSLDELKTRLQRIEKGLADVQGSQQSMNARLESSSGALSAPATSTPASTPVGFPPADVAPATAVPRGKVPRNDPPAGFPPDAGNIPGPAAPGNAKSAGAAIAPPVNDLYQTAYGDYNGAKYTLAAAEFNDVIRFYPDSTLAGNAYFYLGEILYKQQKYGPATRQYDKVIEQYSGNPKVPAAQLRKGQALIAIKQNDAGVRELRSLIQRFPNSPESITARAKLSDMGLATPRRAER